MLLQVQVTIQAVRNRDDLECLACPPKYRDMRSFYKYYSGETVAPYPTLFSMSLQIAKYTVALLSMPLILVSIELACFWLRGGLKKQKHRHQMGPS